MRKTLAERMVDAGNAAVDQQDEALLFNRYGEAVRWGRIATRCFAIAALLAAGVWAGVA